MIEDHRSALAPDVLLLAGRIQVDTAIAVLGATGVNPYAEASLRSMRALHEVAATGSQTDLSIRLGNAAAMKADIRESALRVGQDPAFSEEERIAASGLAAILGLGQ